MAVLDELLVRLGVDMSEAEGEVERGADGITGQLDGLAVAGGVAAAGLGAAFAVGLESALDISGATTQLQNQLDLTDEEDARAGDLAGDVFAQGFGESMDEVSAALSGVASNIKGFADLSEDELEGLTTKALALAKSFNQDVSQATRAAGQLLKTGMAANAEEAFDIIAAGLQRGADSGGDFLDTLISGADNLKTFGFTGDQATGLIVQGMNAGAESADSVIGLFEELVGNVSAGGDDLAQTFKDLRLDAGQMTTDLTAGGPAANKALDTLLDSIRNLKDPIKQDAIMAALFGEEGAAMQNTLLAIDPSTATAALGEFGGAAQKVTDNLATSPAQQWESIMRTVSTTLGTMLLPALRFVSELFKEHPGLLQVLIPLVLGVAAALALAAVAQWAMNTALFAFPGTWIILAIMAVIAIFVLLWKRSQTFRDIVTAVWRVVSEAISARVREILAVISWLAALPGKIGGWFGQAKDWAVRKMLELVSWLAGLPGRVGRAVGGMFDGIPRAFRGAINAVISAWNGLSFTIGGGSIMGVDIPSMTLGTPNIPMLAEGGIATRPTVAMVGEGSEKEAILPLSRLDQLLNTSSRMSSKMQPAEVRYVLAFEGAEDAFINWFQDVTHRKGGGSVSRLAGEG